MKKKWCYNYFNVKIVCQISYWLISLLSTISIKLLSQSLSLFLSPALSPPAHSPPLSLTSFHGFLCKSEYYNSMRWFRYVEIKLESSRRKGHCCSSGWSKHDNWIVNWEGWVEDFNWIMWQESWLGHWLILATNFEYVTFKSLESMSLLIMFIIMWRHVA